MKHKLALSNLIISQFLAIIFLIFAYLNWFPHSLSELTGFNRSALILILANLVLGPFLILLFNKKDKKNLKLDLLILAAIQISALLFGMYSIYQKHPVYAVFTVDRFTLISAKTAKPEKAQYKEFVISLFSEPKFAFAKMPENEVLRNEVLMGHVFKGEPDLDGRPEYYKPYADHIETVISRSLPLYELLSTFEQKEKLQLFLTKYGGNIDSYAYLPIQTNKESAIWVLDKSTARPLGLLNIDPWELKQPLKNSEKIKVHRDIG